MLYDIDSIRIDGANYAVNWLDMPDIPFDSVAEVSYARQKISVIKSHPEHDLQSLLHEIMHVINYNRLGDKLIESEVNTIGCSLSQLILDNTEEFISMASCGLEINESDSEIDSDNDLEL